MHSISIFITIQLTCLSPSIPPPNYFHNHLLTQLHTSIQSFNQNSLYKPLLVVLLFLIMPNYTSSQLWSTTWNTAEIETETETESEFENKCKLNLANNITGFGRKRSISNHKFLRLRSWITSNQTSSKHILVIYL